MIANSRPAALVAGLPTYFTGKPCPAGHVAHRYVANWTCVECNAIKIKGWRANNRAKVNEDSRAWNRNNKARAKTTTLAWRAANPDAVRAMVSKARGIRRRAEGTHSASDITTLRMRQKDRCAHEWCRVSLRKGYHVDHIIAVSKGGSNWPRNLQLLCAPCNHKKHARHPIDVARENGALL